MEQIQPLYDKILVKPIKKEKTSGGIIIQSAELGPDEIEGTRARVIATGPGRLMEDGKNGSIRKMTVQVGDTIIIGKYGHVVVEYNDEKHLMVSEIDILGVVHD